MEVFSTTTDLSPFLMLRGKCLFGEYGMKTSPLFESGSLKKMALKPCFLAIANIELRSIS